MGTEKLDSISCAHVEAEEGYREVCSCPLCPRCGGRRVQRSLPLSPVPILRRKKGTEKLAPVTCAHVAAEKWAQAEFVLSTAPLRYEPCTQFINVSQRALHIYFIDGCRVCPLDARYKNRTKQPLVGASSHRGIPFYFCMARNTQHSICVPTRNLLYYL